MDNEFIEIARDSLEDKKIEVERFLNFVKSAIDSKANVLLHKNYKDEIIGSEIEVSRGLIKSMTATGYLLIYNLIESTMTHGLDAIHSQINSKMLGFSKLSKEVQAICFNNFKTCFTENDVFTSSGIDVDNLVPNIGYDKRRLFSGNINAKIIQKKAKLYGFKIADHDKKTSLDGKRLNDIKEKRNELAHGSLSFEECGQSTSIDELLLLYGQAVLYLDATLNGIEEYLVSEAYLSSEECMD